MTSGVEAVWRGWKTVGMLGEGSFGKVYEIVRSQFDMEERSAVKVISIPTSFSEVKSMYSDGMSESDVTAYYEGIVKEFVREIMLLSKLKGHANIVGYEDYAVVERKDRFGWDIYIRMELLTSLPNFMATSRRLSPDATINVRTADRQRADVSADVIRMAIDICSALETCYEHRIVHRDIKPDNIFVSADGTYKLGDFGVARTVDKTMSDLSKKGTYTYMAPELYKGEPGGMNADLYSLGIVMYRLLNENREPFLPPAPQAIRYEDKQQAIARRMNGDAFLPPLYGERALFDVICKACAYHPCDRYQTPTQMKQALLALLEPPAPPPVPVIETAPPPVIMQEEELPCEKIEEEEPVALDVEMTETEGSSVREERSVGRTVRLVIALACVAAGVVCLFRGVMQLAEREDTFENEEATTIDLDVPYETVQKAEMDTSKGYFYSEKNIPDLSNQGVKGLLKEVYYTTDGKLAVTLKLSNGTPKEMEVTSVEIRVFNDKDETVAEQLVSSLDIPSETVVESSGYGEIYFEIDQEYVVKTDDPLSVLGSTLQIGCRPTDGSVYEAPEV